MNKGRVREWSESLTNPLQCVGRCRWVPGTSLTQPARGINTRSTPSLEKGNYKDEGINMKLPDKYGQPSYHNGSHRYANTVLEFPETSLPERIGRNLRTPPPK
jgi:hypothetical protein